MEQIYEVTRTQLAGAFTEWRRRFEEEPDRFSSEAEVAADGATAYGDTCAPYLLMVIAERVV